MIGKELVGKEEERFVCVYQSCLGVTMPCRALALPNTAGLRGFICGKILRQLTDLLLHASLYP